MTVFKNSKLTCSTHYSYILVASLFILFLPIIQGSGWENDRTIIVINESGRPIELYWIDPNDHHTGQLMADDTALAAHGSEQRIQSYVGDKFEARESPDPDTGVCGSGDSPKYQSCRIAAFTVKQDEVTEQKFYIRPNFKVVYKSYKEKSRVKNDSGGLNYVRVPSLKEQKKLRPPGPRSKCQDQATTALDLAMRRTLIDSSVASHVLEEYVSCVEANLTGELVDSGSHLHFLSNTLNTAKEHFENYTCADFNLTTTAPIRNVTWTNKNINYNIGILHEREHSKIHLLNDFITDEECQAMEDAANPILQVAVVDDGKGGAEVSKHRKALQAGIKVAWDKEEEGDLIARLSRRVYDYANHVLPGLNIRENGQEDLMSIQYVGRGRNDTEPDQYLPHCDGQCSGLRHQWGARTATMVLYCTIPTQGGATNFRKAAIHIEPKKNDGTFFSYIGVDDLIMDNGFTEHSGCPVVEGEKKIVTQWIRYGVDDKHPHNSSHFT